MSVAIVVLWVSLALSMLAVVAAGGLAARRGLTLWRDFKRFSRIVGAASDALASRADEAARKAGAAGSAAERLAAANGRLSRSLAYARVVADAAGDARATLTGIRGSVPRK